jgi:hypothetical protein
MDIIILWAALILSLYGGGCIYIACTGVTVEAPLELRVAWWTGRVLMIFASVALWLVGSKALLILAQWVMR